jgi:hypothetical protein
VQLRVYGCLDVGDAGFLGSGRARRGRRGPGVVNNVASDWRCGRRRWSGNELRAWAVPRVRRIARAGRGPDDLGSVEGRVWWYDTRRCTRGGFAR